MLDHPVCASVPTQEPLFSFRSMRIMSANDDSKTGMDMVFTQDNHLPVTDLLNTLLTDRQSCIVESL